MLLTISTNSVWAAEETVTLSSGTFSTDHITWTAANGNVTITQLKGTSSTAVNSSYVSAPRVYKGHVLSFVAAEGYKINSIEITCNSTYYGNSMTAGTAISDNVVTDNTTAVSRTWASTSGGKHVVSAVASEGLSTIYIQNVASASNVQLRFTGLKISYTTSGGSNPVTVTGVSLDESEISLEVGETHALTATVAPANATNKSVTWTSNNANVATVSNEGLVTAVSTGNATITVTTADGNKTATCAVEVVAASPKSSLIFTAKCNGSGTADDGAKWIVTSDGTESTYDGTKGIHYGTSSAAVGWVQLSTSDIHGTIKKVVVNASGASGTSAAISVKVGTTDFIINNQTSSPIISTAADFEFTGSANGKIVVYISQTSAKKAIYCKSIVVSYESNGKQEADLAYDEEETKKLTKLGDSFTAPTLTNPHGLTVVYESNNTDIAEVAADGSLTIKAVGVAEITASFAGDENYNEGSASYAIYVTAHAGTEVDPYTVADARLAIDKVGETGIEDKYVSGIVSNVKSLVPSQYERAQYYISDDGERENELYIYNGYYLNGVAFTSVDQLMSGDDVVVKGKLLKFNTTYEVDQNNQLISLNRTKTPAGLAYAIAEIEKNVGDAAFTNPLTNPNNLNITYNSSAENVATVSTNGEVTIVGIGTTTITVSFAGDAVYLAGEASYTLKVNDPSLTKVTFDATVDKGESPLSKSNITLSCSNGVLNNESEYRLYKSSTTTFACSAGNIAMIEFIGVSGNPASGFAAPAEGNFVTDGNNATWTGNATSVSFEASGAQVRATKIFVSYREDTRTEAGLAYEVEEVEKVVGDEPFTNALTNPNSVYVSFTSSDETVAEVAANGQATIKAVGTTTISAVFEGNETYKPATVSYTLTVAAPVAPFDGDYFVKVTNANDLTSGEYLIVYGEGSLAFNGALETLDAVSNTIPVVFDHDKIQGTNEALTAVFTINATAGTIQSASGMYIGQTSDANGLATSAETAYTNTITFDEEGNANIVSGGAYLRYNSASNQTRFRYYKSSSYTNQQTIQLYKKESAEPVEPELDYTAVRENLEVGRHYTICLEKKIVAVRGATFWGINNCSEDNLTVYLEMQQPPFDAGKPFIFHATAETLEVAYEGDAVGAPTTNGALRGTFVDMNAAALEGIEGDVYMMYNNTFRPLGSGNHLDAHRAYLLFDALVPGTPAPGRTVRSMPMQGNVTTDIEDAEASAKPMKKLIDGQLFIMCGEKLYDATGRQVK